MRFHCIVIGGGAIGASLAYHLVRTGASIARVVQVRLRFRWLRGRALEAYGVRPAQSEWLLAREASHRWPNLETDLGARAVPYPLYERKCARSRRTRRRFLV